jgi:hypothetical protein
LTESKKQPIFEKTREILSKYELTGISKNELARELQQAKVASRATFYEYFEQMADPKGANIIRKVVPEGKINYLCFPTRSNQIMTNLKGKFKSIKNLMELIEKNPMLGDCFIPLPNLKKVYDADKIPPDTGFGYNTALYTEIIHSKKTSFGESNSVIGLRAHRARHDFLKELSIFLTHYLNSSKRKYSHQIKTECIKILTPIFLRALKILNDDYLDTINVSKKFKETIQLTAPKDAAVLIGLVRGPVMPQIEIEFLKILGRYYYSISKKFSNKMKIDSCKEQKLISEVIRSFYAEDNLIDSDNEKLDTQEIKKILSLNSNMSAIRNKDDILDEYDFNKNNLAIRLAKTYSKDEENTDDALHIKIYYLKLFLHLNIFNDNEQQILQYIIKHDEKVFKSKKWIDPKEIKEAHEALFPNEFSKHK